jgi:Fic family protein
MTFSAVTYERCKWVPSIETSYLSEPDYLKLTAPYFAAVLSPIAHVNVEFDSRLQDMLLNTVESIVRFDTMLDAKSIVMPSVLLRSESASSSQIERLTASNKNIAISELGGKTKDNAALVASNIRAMKLALERTADVTKDSILEIHKALMAETMPNDAGVFRDQQVWIGGTSISPHNAKYVAPHHLHVEEYLSDLISFAQRRDIHPILKAAIVHAQFETIHPFIDGNGRTGRALIQVVLHQGGIIRKSALPISAGLLADTSRYFKALESYRDGDPESIIAVICDSALLAIETSSKTVNEIETLRDGWKEIITARKDSSVWELLDILFEQPVITAAFVHERLGISDISARNTIETILDAGIIAPIKNQKRNVMYICKDSTKLLDDFSSRIARRKLQ